jgi:Cys-tRNA(Pro)/Cys-tRNA(Cys) deacylase
MKTRAMQFLDKAGIRYDTREFEEVELSAEEASEKLGIPLDQVFKTLVVRGDRTGVMLACVPGTTTLSLKAMARASGNKQVELVDTDEIVRLTGYLRGGVSPLGGKRAYTVFLDESVLRCPSVSISAGMRGMQIVLSPDALVRATRAAVAAIGEPAGSSGPPQRKRHDG